MTPKEIFEGAPVGDLAAEFPVPGDLARALKAAAWCTSNDEGHNMVHLIASGDEVTVYGSSPLSMGAARCEANVIHEGVVSLRVSVARELASIVKNWADRAEPPTTTLEVTAERIQLVIAMPEDLYGRRVHQTSRPRVVGAEPSIDVPAVLGEILAEPKGDPVRTSPDQSNSLRQIAQMAKENLTYHPIIGSDAGRSTVQIEDWFTATVSCRKEEHHADTDAPADVSDLPEVEADDDADAPDVDEDAEPEATGWTPRIVNADPPGGMA